MEKKTEPLVKGTFDPSDAKQIIFDLFDSKIKFHSMTAFGIHERTGRDTSYHDKRSIELAKSRDRILKMIRKADAEGMHVVIECDVKIRFQKKG